MEVQNERKGRKNNEDIIKAVMVSLPLNKQQYFMEFAKEVAKLSHREQQYLWNNASPVKDYPTGWGAPYRMILTKPDQKRIDMLLWGFTLKLNDIVKSLSQEEAMLFIKATLMKDSLPLKELVQLIPTTLADVAMSDALDKYRCPISLDVMTDPGYIEGDPTGQRFNHPELVAWVTDHTNHPTSRIPCSLGQVKHDDVLKQEIDDYQEAVIRQFRL